jgi:hypothetical protein
MRVGEMGLFNAVFEESDTKTRCVARTWDGRVFVEDDGDGVSGVERVEDNV